MAVPVKPLSKLFNRVFRGRPRDLNQDMVYLAEMVGSAYQSKRMAKIQNDDQLWDAIRSYLERGANVDARGDIGSTVLATMCEKGRTGVVAKLIEAGADVNIPTGSIAITPVMRAAIEGHYDIMKLLVDNGADLNAVTAEHQTSALQLLINNAEYTCRDNPQRGRDCLQLLLDHGLSLTPADKKQVLERAPSLAPLVPDAQAALAVAAAVNEGDAGDLQRRLDNGVPPDAGAAFTEQPLQTAILLGDKASHIEELLAAGADINLRSVETGRTPLQTAAHAGNRAAFTRLLYLGADPDAPRADGNPGDLLELSRLGNHEGMEEFVRQTLANRASCPDTTSKTVAPASTGPGLRLRLKTSAASP